MCPCTLLSTPHPLRPQWSNPRATFLHPLFSFPFLSRGSLSPGMSMSGIPVAPYHLLFSTLAITALDQHTSLLMAASAPRGAPRPSPSPLCYLSELPKGQYVTPVLGSLPLPGE